MDTVELLHRLAVALAIGLLIGVERGWQARSEPEGGRAAGLRTHALAGLLGGVWGALIAPGPQGSAGGAGLVALAIVFSVVSLILAFYRYRETLHDRTFGATTVVAVMLAFALGALAVTGDMTAAGAAGVATAGLLAMKTVLHGWLSRITWPELRSALILLAMTFIALPALPDRTIDAWGLFNPFQIWLMTVVLAAISFAGYVAIRITGETAGIALTGIAGGLASSTATTVTLARLAKEHPERASTLMGGASLSSATMMARVLTVVAVMNPMLLAHVVLPIGLAAAALALTGWWLLGRQLDGSGETASLEIENPFDLKSVLKFAALLAGVSALAKIVTAAGGSAGVYGLAALSGIADVDAITVSMASDGAAQLGPAVAANAILIVVLVNTVSKAVLGAMAGEAAAARWLALSAAIAVAAGLAGAALAAIIVG